MPRQTSPFRTLTEHFVRRLSAPEEEQASGGMGLGLGAVLALLACPGAFASIFLLNKYSTLLQWLRGIRMNAIERSPSDEYFFVVLSMTITGLVMVARWNRLFPDRRDFANLAVLPIPIRNIFFANFAALLGLAVLFAIDVNAVSAVLFPFFITLSIGTAGAFLRVGVAHAVTVFSSSMFSFFAVFALVGTLMLVVPKRIFRPVSLLARMSLVVLLLTEFFSNIFIQLFADRLPKEANTYVRYLPSYWFLGIYETLVGIAKPHMVFMAKQALLSLAIVMAVSLLAYTLCYRKFFLKLPESFDTMGSSRPFLHVRFPEALLSPLFRSQFERACSGFSLRVLLRSEQHLMFFGAYLGLGLVIVAQNALDSTAEAQPSLPGSAFLAIPLLIAFFAVSGLRFVFDRPAALDCNWVFRTGAGFPQPSPSQVAKRLMLWATIPWECLLAAPLSIERLGWLLGLLYVAALIAATVLFVDILLLTFRKIPFTCNTQMDIKRMLVRMIATVFAVLAIVPTFAAMERWMLQSPPRFAGLALFFAVAWCVLARRRRDNGSATECLIFEDVPGSGFELLKLN